MCNGADLVIISASQRRQSLSSRGFIQAKMKAVARRERLHNKPIQKQLTHERYGVLSLCNFIPTFYISSVKLIAAA